MTQGLRLLDRNKEKEAARVSFEYAASAIEAVIARSDADTDRDFHRVIAASCYHLAGFAARAFSLLRGAVDGNNTSDCERALTLLMLRDLDSLTSFVAEACFSLKSTDSALIDDLGSAILQSEVGGDDDDFEPLLQPVVAALSDNFLRAIGIWILALERGERTLLEASIERLRVGLDAAADLGLVPPWWCHRLAIYLLRDLWDSSFHERLPGTGPSGLANDWNEYRELFIASLLRRNRAEIDLWPSQLEAAKRAVNVTENIVVALPTSAGKTRIAELCILACLSTGRRVVFVTPLRALSAQTEVTLRRTFGVLGKTVSSLYGAIGVSELDQDVLSDSSIIVATPEKLDFALRSQPDLLDDVGLVVLDEGHMIGLTEREVRYEVQIQRLMRRADGTGRRIVCLSAILPDGKQVEDFTAWLTRDQVDGLIKKDWRPTRLRYGEVEWKGDHARLNISVGSEQPWIESFLSPTLPRGRRSRQYPADQRELCIATAWTLVADGHSVLIFCPLRKSVEPFAKTIVDLAHRGVLNSVLQRDSSLLTNAIALGTEWLGVNSPILECLRLGVAIHHGALPTAYRKEIERLLREGVLKLTVSSPTLAQGLNLSATTLIFHGLIRNREHIDIAEFRNVVGRAGRAYVDVEGLVLLPMFDNVDSRRRSWKEMIESAKGKEMESGLIRLLISLLQRMARKHQLKTVDSMIEYLGGVTAWEFPVLSGETAAERSIQRDRWNSFLTTLDTAILSMLGEAEVNDEEIEATLDAVLHESLWTRRLQERTEGVQAMLREGLVARTRHIWSKTSSTQRRSYFLAGVGLTTGQQLDALAPVLNTLLATSNAAIIGGDTELAVLSITEFAEKVFGIEPFCPDELPADWKTILHSWLRGERIVEASEPDNDILLHFVEQALVYRLPWAMEAVRVRAVANEDVLPSGIQLKELELTAAVAAVETGSANRSVAVLIRAGFASRLGAIAAISAGGGEFENISGLRGWLSKIDLPTKAADPLWPTPESHQLWIDFLDNWQPGHPPPWSRREGKLSVNWDNEPPSPQTPVRLLDYQSETMVVSADFIRLGRVTSPLNSKRTGLARVNVGSDGTIDVTYFGPNDLRADRPAS
jgi:superfamily II DNA/RNA helicase